MTNHKPGEQLTNHKPGEQLNHDMTNHKPGEQLTNHKPGEELNHASVYGIRNYFWEHILSDNNIDLTNVSTCQDVALF